jgi:hypothetical protein
MPLCDGELGKSMTGPQDVLLLPKLSSLGSYIGHST